MAAATLKTKLVRQALVQMKRGFIQVPRPGRREDSHLKDHPRFLLKPGSYRDREGEGFLFLSNYLASLQHARTAVYRAILARVGDSLVLSEVVGRGCVAGPTIRKPGDVAALSPLSNNGHGSCTSRGAGGVHRACPHPLHIPPCRPFSSEVASQAQFLLTAAYSKPIIPDGFNVKEMQWKISDLSSSAYFTSFFPNICVLCFSQVFFHTMFT